MSRKLTEVEVFLRHGGILPRTREDLVEFIEEPMLRACQILYDKNVRTFWACGCIRAIMEGVATIQLDWARLSTENRLIAQQVEGDHWGKGDFESSVLTVPVSEETTVEELEALAIALVEQFSWQSADWLPRYTREQAAEKHLPVDEMYWSADDQLYYWSSEHYRKAHETIKAGT